MKRLFFVIVLMAAVTVAAHSQGTSPSSTPTQQTGAQAAATPPAPPAGKPMPQAKTQEEFKAYQEAATQNGGAAVEAAADAFAAKYATSELRILLYRTAMFNYQSVNNGDKTIEMAKKMLALDPNNPEALVTWASLSSQSTRETDLDREERLNEAVKNAERALETIESDLILPANFPPERAKAAKDSLRAMAYDALGTIAMARKDYPRAETNLSKAAALNPLPDPVTYLRLSVALDQQKKYPQALEAANKAVQYSADAPQANNLAKLERDRLQKLVNAAATPAPAAPAKPPQ